MFSHSIIINISLDIILSFTATSISAEIRLVRGKKCNNFIHRQRQQKSQPYGVKSILFQWDVKFKPENMRYPRTDFFLYPTRY